MKLTSEELKAIRKRDSHYIGWYPDMPIEDRHKLLAHVDEQQARIDELEIEAGYHSDHRGDWVPRERPGPKNNIVE